MGGWRVGRGPGRGGALCGLTPRPLVQLPWKSLTSIIEYYYMWKTTDRYVQQVGARGDAGGWGHGASGPPSPTCIPSHVAPVSRNA